MTDKRTGHLGLEPGSEDISSHETLHSIAISLKRIADRLVNDEVSPNRGDPVANIKRHLRNPS